MHKSDNLFNTLNTLFNTLNILNKIFQPMTLHRHAYITFLVQNIQNKFLIFYNLIYLKENGSYLIMRDYSQSANFLHY